MEIHNLPDLPFKKKFLFLLYLFAYVWFYSMFPCCVESAEKNNPHLNPLSGDILIFSAASLSDSVREICSNFEKENPGLKTNISVDSSSRLAKQIERGAPADIYLSANVQWMDFLESSNLIINKTRIEPLSNRLVIITHLNNRPILNTVQDLKNDNITGIAIADYNSVPAGIYSKQTLENISAWKHILPKLVVGIDVRTAMAYVERNEVDYGIVYATDAKISKKVKIVFPLPEESQPDIKYSFSVLKNAPNRPAAIAFIEYLKNIQSQKIFEQYGFISIISKQ